MSAPETEDTNLQVRFAVMEAKFTALGEKVDGMQTTLTQVRDAVIKQVVCPTPGRCLAIDAEMADLKKRVAKLEIWQAGLIMLGTIAVLALTFFGPALRKLIGMTP